MRKESIISRPIYCFLEFAPTLFTPTFTFAQKLFCKFSLSSDCSAEDFCVDDPLGSKLFITARKLLKSASKKKFLPALSKVVLCRWKLGITGSAGSNFHCPHAAAVFSLEDRNFVAVKQQTKSYTDLLFTKII